MWQLQKLQKLSAPGCAENLKKLQIYDIIKG
jgi:hypothetical protein